MKGLLLKDWYMIKNYCRSYILISVVFIVLSVIGNGDMFFVFYPCLLCGMIPVTLLGYDERSRWTEYSGTMPYTRAQIVSGKYLIGLFAQLTAILLMGIVQGIRIKISQDYSFRDFSVLMLLMMSMAALTASIPLPFIFKLGVEKGRMAYYIMIGFACAASVLASNALRDQLLPELRTDIFLWILLILGIGAYSLSWYLSVVFYKKREIC